nr:flagellar basal body L-ring protein FlgH [Telmatospirillum sp. J64-1]
MSSLPLVTRAAILAAAALSLSACNTVTRLSEVGSGPKISQIENPVEHPSYRQVSMPMPQIHSSQPNANSLWRPGSRAFFKDQRAAQVGDILTVAVNIRDEASMNNSTTRSRSGSEAVNPLVLMGLENRIATAFSSDGDPNNLASLGSTSAAGGNGQMAREENIRVNLAAVITQILPNGNLVIAGRQEVRVNQELRELTVTGVIRPEDISSSNVISSEKIAEARISYGGRGTISDVQQPRYGQQIFDILFPF